MPGSDAADAASAAWKRPFLTIAVGQTVSLVCSSAVQFALIWWLATETESPMMMSLAGLLGFLPQFLLGPFAGVWIDRLPRKAVIITADLFIGVAAALFALAFVYWDLPVWTACVVLGVRSVGSAFHLPAIQAVVPMLVPRDQLVRANAWSQFMQSGAFMLGPVVGAAMYAAWPLPVIMLSDLVGALAASLTVAVVAIPELEKTTEARPGLLAELREGVAVLTQDRRLTVVTAALAVIFTFFLPLASYYPLMTSSYFKLGAWHASVVEITYATGMMLGAAVLSAAGTVRNKLAAVHVGMVLTGITTLLAGVLPSSLAGFALFAAVSLVMGASGNVLNIPFTAYIQETVPFEAQGRAFSLIGSLMSLAMPVGLVIAGPVAERHGVPVWFVVSGIVSIIVTTLSALTVLPRRQAAA